MFASEFTFLSCGDIPGEQLFKEASVKKIEDVVPVYLRKWINLE
jgi:hypothetical protein